MKVSGYITLRVILLRCNSVTLTSVASFVRFLHDKQTHHTRQASSGGGNGPSERRPPPDNTWHLVANPGIFSGGGSTNSVEYRGHRERGSEGDSPLVRGSTQFANE
jgi:hypothetical protein